MNEKGLLAAALAGGLGFGAYYINKKGNERRARNELEELEGLRAAEQEDDDPTYGLDYDDLEDKDIRDTYGIRPSEDGSYYVDEDGNPLQLSPDPNLIQGQDTPELTGIQDAGDSNNAVTLNPDISPEAEFPNIPNELPDNIELPNMNEYAVPDATSVVGPSDTKLNETLKIFDDLEVSMQEGTGYGEDEFRNKVGVEEWAHENNPNISKSEQILIEIMNKYNKDMQSQANDEQYDFRMKHMQNLINQVTGGQQGRMTDEQKLQMRMAEIRDKASRSSSTNEALSYGSDDEVRELSRKQLELLMRNPNKYST